MRIPKKRCQFCHGWFEADKRKVNIQTTCMNPDCQRRRQGETSAACWKASPVQYKDRRIKIRAWAKKKKYDRHYRANHPDYREREVQRMRKKRKRLKTVARQISITRVTVEDVWRSLGMTVVTVARQIPMSPVFMGAVPRGRLLAALSRERNVARQISIPALR